MCFEITLTVGEQFKGHAYHSTEAGRLHLLIDKVLHIRANTTLVLTDYIHYKIKAYRLRCHMIKDYG